MYRKFQPKNYKFEGKDVEIYYWVSDFSNITSLPNRSTIPYSELYPTIEKIINLGLYVMLLPHEGSLTLAIDDRPFYQR